jgi:hypothetical protein
MGRMSARTGYGAAIRIRRIVSQQLRQRGSPGLVHGGSQGGLDRFQIERDTIAALLKNNPQEAVYFAGNFLVGWPAPFFFLGRLLSLLDGPQAADLSIHIDQLARQGLELTELSDLTFRLTDGSRRRQILGDRLALDFLGELKMRAVCGVVGFGAMANGTATAAGGTGDGTGLEIAEFGNLPEQGGSVADQSRQRVWHRAS